MPLILECKRAENGSCSKSSYPTPGGPACTRDESENIVRVCFPCQQPGLLRKCESYKMPCPLPQMSVFLLRQGNSVLLLGPHPSCVVYWLFEVPLLTIWVNSVLICFPNTSISSRSDPWNKCSRGTFTFMHLADTFIQSDLQCILAMHFWSVYFFAKSALVWPFSSRSDPSSKCTKCSVAKRS